MERGREERRKRLQNIIAQLRAEGFQIKKSSLCSTLILRIC